MAFTTALQFFQLFFTLEIVIKICDFTNLYAQIHRDEKISYEWTDMTPDEFYSYLGLIIYMGLVPISSLEVFWSQDELYRFPFPQSVMSLQRFKAINSNLHVVDPETDKDKKNKLRKVAFLVEHFKKTCKELYIPSQSVSVDERMVKSKGRSGIRQYIKNKPTKFGIKVWVLAESNTGYTVDFDIYTGAKGKTKQKFERGKGLGYQVVMGLCEALRKDGYHIYFDNFFTSGPLLDDLKKKGFLACGTTQKSRLGYPLQFKGTDAAWNKKSKRGDMRWFREGDKLIVQWKDKRVVTIMTTLHNANESDLVDRNIRVGDKWEKQKVRRPQVFGDYNKNMGGVDLSDQLIGKFNVLRKVNRWWRTLFFHVIDIAIINSYIMFRACYEKYKITGLQRKKTYNQRNFREELVKQLCGTKKRETQQSRGHEYVIENRQKSRNCVWCYHLEKLPNGRGKERKITTFCKICDKHFCNTGNRDCMAKAHREENVSTLLALISK